MKRKNSKGGKMLCLALAVLLVIGAMPMYSTLASAGTDEEPTVEASPSLAAEPTEPEPASGSEPTPTQTEPEASPTPSAEPEQSASPTPSAMPTVSPEVTPEPSEEPEETETVYENSISGVLWLDENEDGTYDSGEAPVADYPVYLYAEGDTDNAVQTATTDAEGKYIFEGIQPGSYVVGVKSNELGTDKYLLPLIGVQKDNKFGIWSDDWTEIYSDPVGVSVETVVADINAGMRTPPTPQPMANATYTIDVTNSTTVTNSITSQSIPGVTFASNILTFNTSVDPTDTYILTGTTTTVRVVVATGVTANITLNGASMTSSTYSPFQLSGTSNVNLTLAAGTTNTLTCTGATTHSTYSLSGLAVTRDASITIDGTGTLNATGGYQHSGIGGGATTTGVFTSTLFCGTIVINSGNIIAKGGNYYGAGIGNGYTGSASATSSNITINGGTITATGGDMTGLGNGGPGIGFGNGHTSGTITITGGTVIAIGGTGGSTYPSGVGIGLNNSVVSTATVDLVITGGTVTATAGNSGRGNAGIGQGEPCLSMSITISGGTVTATATGTNNPGIGSYNYNSASAECSIVFTGGSIYPTASDGTVGTLAVYPTPTNGSIYGDDPVGMLTFNSLAGQNFTIMTAGSAGATYAYNGVAHATAAYPWLPYPGVTTEAATSMSTTAAVVTAPSSINTPSSSTATLNGTYYLNNTYAVSSAYFEYGTTTSYGSNQPITPVGTIATSVETASANVTGLLPGTTYHYRFVIVTNGITVEGNDVTFTTPALAPSVDASHNYSGGTTATLYGIYDLNGGTFTSGEFELSTDGGSTWTTPTGSTLTGTTTTPTASLTGLVSGTTYHYRLTVTNSEGTTSSAWKELTVSNFTITEKYVDTSGNALVPAVADTTQSILPGGTYTGAPQTIPGYVYVGSYIGNTFVAPGSNDGAAPQITNVTADQTVWFVYAKAEGSIKVEKYDNGGITPLANAEFKLEKLVASGGAVDPGFTAVTQTTAGPGGDTTFMGLPAGIYQVTETKAPSGFATLTESFEVTVPHDITLPSGQTPTDTSYLYSTTSGGNVTYHYYNVTYKVSDQAALTMPVAGVNDTLSPYTLLGGLLVLAAAGAGSILLIKRRRTKNQPKHAV